MITDIFCKTLILTPLDRETGAETILSNKNPDTHNTRVKRDQEGFYQNYGAIVLQDGLTYEEFLSDGYKALREAAYQVCKDKIVLTAVQNSITPAI